MKLETTIKTIIWVLTIIGFLCGISELETSIADMFIVKGAGAFLIFCAVKIDKEYDTKIFHE